MASYSLDPDNKKEYEHKSKVWNEKAERFTVTEDMKEHRPDTPQKMVELVNKYSSDEFVIVDDTAELCFAYDLDIDAVVINPKHSMFEYYDYREMMIHELAHRIDQYEFGSPMYTKFSDAIKGTEERFLKDIHRYEKMFEAGSGWDYNNIVSDVMGCITDNVIAGNVRHSSQYIGIPGYTELEVFANIFSALYQGDDKTVEFIKTELYHVYQAFLDIIGG